MLAAYVLTITDGQDMQKRNRLRPNASAAPHRRSTRRELEASSCWGWLTGSGQSVGCCQRTDPSAAPIVAMMTPPSVMETNERRKPVPKNRRRIQASVRSSDVIAASASSTARWSSWSRTG